MKKDKGRKDKKAHVSSEEEDMDEMEEFHAKKGEVKASAFTMKKKGGRVSEVLNVEGEATDSDPDADDSSDFDDDDDKEVQDDGVSGEHWGKKRRDFYATDFVDEDWGGIRDEEMEAVALEEEDAVERQRAIDKTTDVINDLFDEQDKAAQAEKSAKKITKETAFVWKYATVKKLNKETLELLEEYQRRLELYGVVVKPLMKIADVLPKTSQLKELIEFANEQYSLYMTNLLLFFKLKCDSLSKKEHSNNNIQFHPIMLEIQKLKKKVGRVDDFLAQQDKCIRKLLTKVENGQDVSSMIANDERKKIKKASVLSAEMERLSDGEFDTNEVAIGSDGKRLAPKAIAKNKASLKQAGKKKEKIAKTKNRRKFKNISKRVISQVGTHRKESERYGGEARGIRASTIKSTKLIA